MLEASLSELRAVHQRLEATRGNDGEHSAAQREAKRVLERATQALAYARSAGLRRTRGIRVGSLMVSGFQAMLAVSVAADELRLAYPALPRVEVNPGSLHPHRVAGAGSRSVRGRGNRDNQDSVALARTNAAILAALADGLGTAADSRSAAITVTRIALHHLRANAGADPQENIRAAFRAVVRELAVTVIDSDAATTLDPLPAATLLLAQLTTPKLGDPELTLGWVGDTRAYLLPRPGGKAVTGARRLTVDDTYSGELGGQLTRWLAADSAPVPTVTTVPAEPGLVVLATDGAWSHLGTPAEMAQLLPAAAWTDPDLAAEILTGAARAGGSTDDTTVAVIMVPDRGERIRRTRRPGRSPSGGTP
jgi:serine/threonine protein phosphatase PrpC